MRLADFTFAFPALLSAIMLTAIYGPGLVTSIVAIGIFNVPVFARITRASALVVRSREFVTAARALGKGEWQITLEHSADVRALRRDLPEHLEALEAREKSAANYISTPPELRAMGVQHTIPLPAQPEFVRLYPRGWVVDQARPGTALNDFVESMLAENDDVPKKLSRIDATERHAFLWVMPESGRAVVSLLGVGRDWPEQDGTGLSLPDGVSHVWVARTEGGSRVMRWESGKWLRIERPAIPDLGR